MLRVFRKRWFLTLLGLIALSLLIWFAGPLFAFAKYQPLEPSGVRWLVIALVFGIWLLRIAWRWLRDMRNNSQLLSALATPAAKPTATPSEKLTAQQLEELKNRLEQALGLLKKSRVKGQAGKQYVYQLPWYLIIGAPGAGKTTLLPNSGLQFPLADRLGTKPIQGVGTRNCDWWFTEEAVLVDTAGRYFTQDSDPEVDKAEWRGFLSLLKKYRRRRPINGVLVAISVADVLRQTAGERARAAQDIRQRIQELDEVLGIRFPIYVLLTKCDLLAGFMEFFADCGREERSQVWGVTFPLQDAAQQQNFAAAFQAQLNALEQRLNGRVLERVQQERDLQRRALIYAFPQQFNALKEGLNAFVAEAFAASRYDASVMVRGVYLTSSTQEGTPIDRVMSHIAGAMGLDQNVVPANVATGKSYFIERLLRDVVFKESGLGSVNARYAKQETWLLRGAYAGIGLLSLLLLLVWSVSYGRNKHYIASVGQQAEQIKETLTTMQSGSYAPTEVLPLLGQVRAIPGGYTAQQAGMPWGMGYGLSQADKLGDEATDAYYRVLQQVFLPGLAHRLEDHLRRRGTEKPEELFETLRAYLMLTDAKRFDKEVVQNWLTHDFERSAGEIPLELRQDLTSHTVALFENADLHPSFVPDDALVRAARETLLRAPVAERIYSQIKSDADAARCGVAKLANLCIKPFVLTDVAGPDAANVLTRRGAPLTSPIPALFTNRGYHLFFKPEVMRFTEEATKDSWVLGEDTHLDASRRQQIADEIRQIYFAEYIRKWEELLRDVVPKTGSSFAAMADTLRDLARPDSPWKNFLVAAAKDTKLAGAAPPEAAAQGTGRLDKLTGQIKKKAEELVEGGRGLLQNEPETPVDARFAYLHRTVLPGEGSDPPPIVGVQAALAEAQAGVRGLAEKEKKGDPITAAEILQSTDKLKSEGARFPEPVGTTLKLLAQEIGSRVRGSEYSRVSSELRTKVAEYCLRGVRGRYPLSRTSPQEVTQDDFGRFFGPNGVMDGFFQTELKPVVDTTHGTWRSKPDAAVPVSQRALSAFQNAGIIRDVFFRAGGQAPGLAFDLKPLTMDPRITQFILDLDGQLVTYSHGPSRIFSLKWPVPGGAGRVRIQISPPAPSGQSGVSQEGPWALFRMLDKANFQTTEQPDRFKVTFDVEGRSASFELRASSVYNPFRLSALEQFACPDKL